jgi:uncharacterized protein
MNIARGRGVAVSQGVLAAVLTSCSSTPPTHFHSLVAPPVSSGNSVHVVPASGVRFELLPVTVPVQVDVPQFVVRLTDGSVTVLEHERWIGPLPDEIRSAVALRVDQALAGVPPANGAASNVVWRVSLDVQRFDSTLGRAAGVQLAWSLQPAGGAAVLRCQASYEEPVSAGVNALAAGHRAVFERLGDVIGSAVKAAAAGAAPSCG